MIKRLLCFHFILSTSLLSIMGQSVVYLGCLDEERTAAEKVIKMEKTSDDCLIIASTHNWGPRLYKHDNNGKNEWILDMSIQGENTDIRDFTLDGSDNIYALIFNDIYGERIKNEITFYPGYNLMKISPQGMIVWNKKLGETADFDSETRYYTHCISYKKGNLYIMGTYIDFLDLENQYHFISQKYYQYFMWRYQFGSDYYIAKYDTTGILKNAVSFGEDYPDELIDMTMDDDENIYFTGISDIFPGIATYTHITKLDSNLIVQWVDTLTRNRDWDIPAYVPMNIHFSNNGNLYVWNNAFANTLDTLSNGIVTIDETHSPYLIEVNAINGNILRSLNIDINPFETSYMTTKKRYVNGYMDDFGNDLIVHTAKGVVVEGAQGFYGYTYQNLLLFKIDLTNFSETLIAEFGNVPNKQNMPGPIIVKEPFVYFSGTIRPPLNIYGEIINTPPTSWGTDVFYCKMDMSTYLNISGIPDNYSRVDNITIFPNPVSEKLFINVNSKIHTIEIFSINGTKIISTAGRNFCDVSGLKNGIYFIKITTDKGIKLAKFIVSH